MNEFLEIFGLEYSWETKPMYNKYLENLRNEANKLRLVWDISDRCNDNSISSMLG